MQRGYFGYRDRPSWVYHWRALGPIKIRKSLRLFQESAWFTNIFVAGELLSEVIVCCAAAPEWRMHADLPPNRNHASPGREFCCMSIASSSCHHQEFLNIAQDGSFGAWGYT